MTPPSNAPKPVCLCVDDLGPAMSCPQHGMHAPPQVADEYAWPFNDYPTNGVSAPAADADKSAVEAPALRRYTYRISGMTQWLECADECPPAAEYVLASEADAQLAGRDALIAEREARIAELERLRDVNRGVEKLLREENTRLHNTWLTMTHRNEALRATIERLEGARDELSNIANAKRFDREKFDDDRSFADWAQSRARHRLAALAATAKEGTT